MAITPTMALSAISSRYAAETSAFDRGFGASCTQTSLMGPPWSGRVVSSLG